MWVSGLGMAAVENPRAVRGRPELSQPRSAAAFLAARRAMALANALLIAALTLVAAGAIGRAAALALGVLLAFDPWLTAHGRILHLDALLALLLAISAMAYVGYRRGGRWPLLLVAGAAAALAVLTKSSALVVLPLLLGLGSCGGWRARAGPARRLPLRVGVLCLTAGVLALLAWPALAADPLGTARRVLAFGASTASVPHNVFFLGVATDAPGFGFYPLALAFRLSLPVVAGVLVWVCLAARGGPDRRGAIRQSGSSAVRWRW